MKQIKEMPLSSVAPITRVSKLTGPRTVLLGDASHSVTPALGIGSLCISQSLKISPSCNMAIVDGKILNESLKEAAGEIDHALKLFNDRRHAQVQGAQELQEVTPVHSILDRLCRVWQDRV